MNTEIKIPAMGESVSEAIVSSIMKPTGSMVSADDEILELETDKVNQVLYAPESGKLTLNVAVDQKVKIGEVIGYIDTEAKVSEAKTPSPQKTQTAAVKTAAPPSEKKETSATARKMTPEFLAELKEEPKQPAPAKKEGVSPVVSDQKITRKRMSNLRRVIATRLVEAKNTTAMLTTFNEVDMSTIMEIRAKEKDNFTKRYGVKLGFMSFFIKGAIAALKAIPAVNASIDGDEIISYQTYDIGVAVSTEKGLMVPVIRNCDQLSFGEIESSLENYAKKAREGTISVDDLRGGSFTITNGGVFGSLLSTPILNLPQSAILGMHSIVKRPVVVNDQIVIRPMMYLALSYDHRIIDGKEAVLFLVRLKESLEDPTRLLLDL